MTSLKRTFYMLFGFTFPFFWAYHASGVADFLYRPIQFIAGTESRIWPAFITTFILYMGTIIMIQTVTRPKKRAFTPELHTLRQQPLSGRESSLKGHCTEKGQDQPHHQGSSIDQEEFSPKTDQ